MRIVFQTVFDIDDLRDFLNPFLHLFLGDTVIFQRKGNILCDTETDELSIGVLQNGSDLLGQIKERRILCINAADGQRAGDRSAVGIGNQSVQTVSKRALSASRGTCNQDLLPFMDLQIDIIQGRL